MHSKQHLTSTCGIYKNSTTNSWPSNPNVTFPFGWESPCKESVHNEWFCLYRPTTQVDMIVLDTCILYLHIFILSDNSALQVNTTTFPSTGHEQMPQVPLPCYMEWRLYLEYQCWCWSPNLDHQICAEAHCLTDLFFWPYHHDVQNLRTGKLPDAGPETQDKDRLQGMFAHNRPQHRNCAMFLL